ncbi:HD-GYP domain-containing protein [Salidesulfovibrio brasiliensis]|uniref:HD-GYP domain-containing protein n=1 Tax=Salidesulfovibrio brasiliensis TaxID=221711 RepID=UPI0006CFD883|nr:HD domain-containing phosphohydrolase [Salidesulfovibrio brasiliensis]
MKRIARDELWPGMYVIGFRKRDGEDAVTVDRPLLSREEIAETVPEGVTVFVDEEFELSEWITTHIGLEVERERRELEEAKLALETQHAELEHERNRFRQEVADWHEHAMERAASGAKAREEGNAKRVEEMARMRKEMAAARKSRQEARSHKQAGVVEEPPQTPIEEEFPRADKLYSDAVSYARGFIDDVREGKPFDYRDSMPTVDGFIDSVFRNESAAAAICKLKMYDEYTYTHSINVSVLAVILGKRLGLDRDQLRLLGMAGVFHDVGKALIPDEILNKPGKLSDTEMEIMRTHPAEGYKILKGQKAVPDVVLRAALEHHERYDGRGYPRGIKGEKIHLMSRIISVVDVYDALTSKRVYKDPLPPSKVLGMMYQWRLSDFQPNIVEHFIKSLGVYPVGSFVRLSSGEHGVVTVLNSSMPLKPVVKVVYNNRMQPVTRYSVNLANLPSEEGALAIEDIVNPDEHGVEVASLLQ